MMKFIHFVLCLMLAVSDGYQIPDVIDPETSDSKSGYKECIEANACLDETEIRNCSERYGATRTMIDIMMEVSNRYHQECPLLKEGECLHVEINACLMMRENGNGMKLCNGDTMNSKAEACLQNLRAFCNTTEGNKAINDALDTCDDNKMVRQYYNDVVKEIKCLVSLDGFCPNHTKGVLCMAENHVDPLDLVQYAYIESKFQTICPALGQETCLEKKLFECERDVKHVCDENGVLNAAVKTCYKDLEEKCGTRAAKKEIGMFLERCHNTSLWSDCLKTNAEECIDMLHQGPHVVCQNNDLIKPVTDCFENVKNNCSEDLETINGVKSSVCDHHASSIAYQVKCFVGLKTLTVETFGKAVECMRKNHVADGELAIFEQFQKFFEDSKA